MDLILWRHAEAVDATLRMPDDERALTAKGERDAKHMAQWLDGILPSDTVILASPARRTQQTAGALNRTFATVAAIGAGAEPADLLLAAHWPHAANTTLIVGHQPTLGHVASLLLTGAEGELSVKKGAIWWIRGRLRGGNVQCVLRAMMAPDML